METANSSDAATNYPLLGYQPSPASPRGENRQMESAPKPEHAEGPVARTIEQRTAKLSSDTFLWAALGSMAVSCGLQLLGRQKTSHFIGQWAPSFLLLDLYNKIVKVTGSH